MFSNRLLEMNDRVGKPSYPADPEGWAGRSSEADPYRRAECDANVQRRGKRANRSIRGLPWSSPLTLTCTMPNADLTSVLLRIRICCKSSLGTFAVAVALPYDPYSPLIKQLFHTIPHHTVMIWSWKMLNMLIMIWLSKMVSTYHHVFFPIVISDHMITVGWPYFNLISIVPPVFTWWSLMVNIYHLFLPNSWFF